MQDIIDSIDRIMVLLGIVGYEGRKIMRKLILLGLCSVFCLGDVVFGSDKSGISETSQQLDATIKVKYSPNGRWISGPMRKVLREGPVYGIEATGLNAQQTRKLLSTSPRLYMEELNLELCELGCHSGMILTLAARDFVELRRIRLWNCYGEGRNGVMLENSLFIALADNKYLEKVEIQLPEGKSEFVDEVNAELRPLLECNSSVNSARMALWRAESELSKKKRKKQCQECCEKEVEEAEMKVAYAHSVLSLAMGRRGDCYLQVLPRILRIKSALQRKLEQDALELERLRRKALTEERMVQIAASVKSFRTCLREREYEKQLLAARVKPCRARLRKKEHKKQLIITDLFRN